MDTVSDKDKTPPAATFEGKPLKITQNVEPGFLYVHPETLHVWGMLPFGKRTADGEYVFIKES
jgi:hypothetical protein